jgi:hypothetical protein
LEHQKKEIRKKRRRKSLDFEQNLKTKTHFHENWMDLYIFKKLKPCPIL